MLRQLLSMKFDGRTKISDNKICENHYLKKNFKETKIIESHIYKD